MGTYHRNFEKAILEHSQTATRLGIDNAIPAELEDNAVRLSQWLGAVEIRLQAKYAGLRLMVSSGYRSPELNGNKAIGGAANSYHTLALAADIAVIGHNLTPLELCKEIQSIVIDGDPAVETYDKMIHEFGRWVHVQLAKPDQKPVRQHLTAKKESSGGTMKTVYVNGLVDVA